MTERERVGKGDEGGGKMEGEGEREIKRSVAASGTITISFNNISYGSA